MRIKFALKALVLAAAVTAVCGAAAADSVSTLDAKVHLGQVLEITPGEMVLQDGGKRSKLRMDEVAEISFGPPAADLMARLGASVIVTVGGSRLGAGDILQTDDKISFSNSLIGKREIALSAASVIYTPTPNRSANDVVAICQDLKIPQQVMDVLVIQRKSGDCTFIDGVLKEITRDSVIFTWKDEDRKIPRATVLAIRIASSTTRPATAGVVGKLRGSKDDSQILFTSLSLKGQDLRVSTSDLGELVIKRDGMAQVEFESDRVINISKLTPSKVAEHGLFDKAFKYQLNRSAGGSPLKLGGETYLTGLGLHSFCELTYKLDGGYSALVGVVGIDDAVRPAGNARMSIIGDGKNLCQPMDLTGQDDPKPLRLNVAGVKELIIRVEFGTDKLDVADHVNFVSARLVK